LGIRFGGGDTNLLSFVHDSLSGHPAASRERTRTEPAMYDREGLLTSTKENAAIV